VHDTSGLISISISKETEGGSLFEENVLRDSPDEVLFSLHLPTDVVFFKGEARRGDSEFFTVRVKTPVFKVQRREALRLPVPDAPEVALTLQDGRRFKAVLVNISEGGVGVSFKSREHSDAVLASTDPVLLAFSVYGMTLAEKGSVRHGSELSSSFTAKTYRIGFSFLELDPKNRTQLSQLVLEESSKYLGRF
jgi:hypothetical protein